MLECSLEELGKLLGKENIQWKIEKGTEELPTDRLIITMAEDDKKRPLLLELYIFEKSIELEHHHGKQEKRKPKFLNFRYYFPFRFKDEAVNDIARYVLLINKSLEFAGFGMSEVDRNVYFRHDLLCASNKIDSHIFKGLIGYCLLIIYTFGPEIEKLASCKKNFIQLIEENLR
jgi:hypothetical protein